MSNLSAIDSKIKKIISQRINRENRYGKPLRVCHERILRSLGLISFLYGYFHHDLKYKNSYGEELIKEAEIQFITSLVTSMETYFREMIIIISNVCVPATVKHLSDICEQKYRRKPLEKYRSCKISVGEIIANSINLYHIDGICDIFSKVFEINVKDKLYKNYVHIKRPKNVIKLKENFEAIIQEVIELRHDSVHDISITKRITQKRLLLYMDTVMHFLVDIDDLIDESIMKNLKPECRV